LALLKSFCSCFKKLRGAGAGAGSVLFSWRLKWSTNLLKVRKGRKENRMRKHTALSTLLQKICLALLQQALYGISNYHLLCSNELNILSVGSINLGIPNLSASEKANSKFSFLAVGFNSWYLTNSGQKECNKAQKASPGVTLSSICYMILRS
jgi:hypothetical protein